MQQFGTEDSIHECIFRDKVFKFKHHTINALNASGWYFHSEEVLRAKHWLIEKGDIVIDVGANFGAYTLPALVSGAQHVYAFEPHPAIFNSLMENVIMNGYQRRVTPWALPLWSEPNIEFELPDMSCSLMPKANAPERGAHKVRTDTLDRLMGEVHPEKINWLKIDVEGAEIEVLKGARSTIEHYNPNIILEYHVDRNCDPEMEYIKDNFAVITQLEGGHYFLKCAL